jgi:hypothetical protein
MIGLEVREPGVERERGEIAGRPAADDSHGFVRVRRILESDVDARLVESAVDERDVGVHGEMPWKRDGPAVGAATVTSIRPRRKYGRDLTDDSHRSLSRHHGNSRHQLRWDCREHERQRFGTGNGQHPIHRLAFLEGIRAEQLESVADRVWRPGVDTGEAGAQPRHVTRPDVHGLGIRAHEERRDP